MKTLIKKINRILKDRGTRRLLTRIVSVSAALVVFVTTYALVLPAITMETEAQCGIEAHQHSDSCYEDVLVCGLEESEGHTHDDSCYSISHELTCEIPEHQHDKTCYDEDGDLQCKLSEHDHTDSCYKEVRELTCTLEESEGHHHTDACYEKNFICGKEVHTHSPSCYEKTETAAVAASAGYTAGVAYEVNDDDAADDFDSSDTDGLEVTDDTGYTDGLEAAGEPDDANALEETDSPDGADALEVTDGPDATDAPEWTDHNDASEDAVTFEETSDPGDTDASEQTDDPGEPDALEVTSHDAIWEDADSAGTSEAADYSDSSEEAGSTDPSQETDNAGLSDWDPPLQEESEAAPTTNILPEDLENEELSDGYVPQLDSLNFDSVLNDHTAFYYFHPEEGEEVPANSVDIASWKPVDENTELAPTDLVKAYLAYTIPAGSLNETNQVARYRLPSNLHLTEEQILAINSHENGIAAGYIDPETNTVPDEDAANYSEYLGAEAVEGTRRPNQAPGDGSVDGEQEYISATVKAENVFDEEGLYGEKGAYLGQDLIFVFSPYTIQKNQTTYDKDGKPTARGEKVTGWFAVDFNMDQIDWSEPVETILPADKENQTAAAAGLQRIERTANIVFAAEGEDENNHKIHEISTELKLVQENATEITNEDQPVADAEEQVETPESDEVKKPSDEKSKTDQTDTPDSAERADSAENGANTDADSALAENKEGETEKAAPEYKDGTLEANGSGYKITMDYKADARIPENAYLHVTEITRESDAEAYEACLEEARKSVPADGTRVDDKASRFFDIEILVDEPAFEENGDEDLHENEQKNTATENENAESDETQIRTRKIEPAAPVSVNIQLFDTEISQKPDEFNAEQYKVVHIAEDKTEEIQDVKAQMIEPEKKDVSSASTEKESNSDTTAVAPATEVQFEAESFSIYGVVYTVDFEYSVNGKMYQFSLPGGGFVSFTDLVEVLGIIGDKNSEDNNAIIDAATQTVDGTIDVTVSDAAKKFVADVTSVEFSSSELVDVSKVKEDTTVGQIKENRGLKCEYSAELTEEQIEAINAQTVEAGDWALISVQPFTSEEEMTVTMKDGEVFTIHVTDAQIRKTVIDARGDAWEITVTYGEDAQIPDGAELKVREILPEDEKYEEYYEQSLDTTGVINANPEGEYAHVFDIQIWSDEHEVEPASAVAVDIKLLDTPEEEEMDLKVVHFGKDGPKMMDTGSGEETEAGKAELSFMTEEFSVYTVVNVNNSTDIAGGGPWVLVSGIAGDPGATTGYDETWGRDYFTIIVNANAMSDEAVTYQGNNVAFAAEGVHVWTNGSKSYVGGDAPEVWIFERVPNSNNYYIRKNDTNSYIDQHYGNTQTCSLSTQYRTAFTIDRNSDGTISIHNGNWYLCNNGNGEFSGRDFRFQQNMGGQSQAKFRLCKQSDDFDSFAAKKVSVQELTGNDNFLIYRKFMDEAGNEQLYALASDGTFVRVYDGGDSVYWRETDKNVYWNYLKDGTYYGIFSTDPQTGEKKYLNPMASTGATITTESSSLTLIGKDTGEYGTAIENWDQVSYDYAGLHVTLDSQGVPSLGAGTRVAGTSDEFLFAVDSSMPSSTPVPVATVDSDSLGIKITMFDYGDAKTEYSAGTKLSGMTNTVGSGSDAYTPHEAHSLVKPYLESGLPSGSAGAMTGLFSTGGSQVTAYKENVNHLFLQSYYDENGMFRYRSEDNYAYLPFNPDGSSKGNRITSNDFIVYQQAATPYTTDTQPGHTYYYHGHFMPFNDIDTSQHVGRLMNQYGNDYDPNSHTVYGELPIEDGRTYEEIYGTTGIPNFYTGMKMEARFSQPKNGKLDNGEDMIFKFTGDDDMWVYIDDVLILDVGGIHEPLSGTINFATGKVTNPAGSSLAGETTLYQIFQNVLTASSTPQSVKNKINAISWVDVNGDGTPDTFADYGNHTFSSFYMERGAGASNLDIQFNLNVVLTNQFTVTKELPEKIDDRFANQKFRFRATYEQNGQELPLHAGIDGVCISVVYKNRVQLNENGNPVLDANGKTIPVPVPVDQNGYFELMAGETAVFMMANEEIKYNVREVGIDQYNLEEVTIEGGGTTKHVEINNEQAMIDENAAAAGLAVVKDRSSVLYTNYPKTQNLEITKHILGDKVPVDGKEPVFEFRVYLETTEGGTRHLVPYSYGPYYLVKDGVYYTLTGTNNAPDPKGTTPVVCSTTGRSGSINSIPEGYTIVIPNLTIGTSFYLEERRDNIPEGYRYIREELKPDTYDPSSLIAAGEDVNSEEVIDRIIARDENDHQVFDPNTVGQIKDGVDAESHVYNASRTTVSVHKIWDSQPVSGTSVTVELHRYAPLVKGTVGVTLLDQRDVPVKGADFQLQKQDGENWVNVGGTIQTNQNGEASVSNLDAGTYKLVQVSTPEGYTMPAGSETTPVTVQGSTTDKEAQTHMETLHNQALFTAATVQLTLTDAYQKTSDHQDIPISGALFDLYKVGESEPIATGLKTTDGLVAYGPLSAGNYYLVQTFTPEGYILPNPSRIDFEVEEHPGVDQNIPVETTNEAIATATLNITLTGPNGPITGADFAVYRQDGSTASSVGVGRTADGHSSISITGYGTFVLKQQSTAAGLAVAEDQEFTVDRGLTGQEINLTVENEEAAGNNTVIVYTGQGSSINQWNSGDIEFSLTKRDLKAGEEVSYSIRPDNVNGETAWYCLDFNPSTKTGTWQKVTTSPQVITFKVPNGASDMTYNLAVKSNWGMNGQSKITLVESSANAAVVPEMLSMARPMARTMVTPSLTAPPATVNATPPEAPEGYAEDSSFTPITITLDGTVDDTETAAWFAAFASQEAVDNDGNLYYYYVVEKEPVPTGYRIESYSYDKGEPLAGSGTVTITNAKVQSGPLQITKAVTVDGIPVTDANKTFADGTYTFTVEKLNADGTAVDTSFAAKTVTITVTNGEAASDILHDLPFGKYRVTENAVNNGTTVTGITGGTANVANRTTTIEVTDSSTEENPAAVTFTNNTETVTAKIVKVWNHTGNTGTRPTSLTVTLSNGDSRELNENNNWTAEVTDLPKYDRTTGNPIEYSWTEAELPAGYYLSNIQESNDTATGVITTTITNSFTDRYNPTTTITGKKVWDDGGEGRPDSITVNLYKDGGSTPDRTITVQAPTSEGADQNQWPFEFTNLPVFNIDGSVIQYTVEEVLPEGYTDEYGIKIEFSQATYIAGDTTGEIVNSGEGSQTFKISDGFNLGYIVIRHGNDFIIWTPRPATADEISAIKTKVVSLSEQFNGIGSASGDSMKIVSGVPDTVDVGKKHAVSVYMQNGEVWMKFLNPNAWSDFAYGTIPYTYTQAGGEGGGSITNTKKNTDIEFGKQWIDIGQQEIEWDQDIQVTVSRNKADGNKDSTFSLVYTVAKSEVNSAVGGTVEFSTGTEADPKLKLTITTEDGKKKYHFKIENLSYSSETDGKYTYYVEESNSQLAGYLAPSYWNTSAPTGGTAAYDDGIIINKQEGGFELPSTGGPGIRLFTILGSILILGAGVLLWRRRQTI